MLFLVSKSRQKTHKYEQKKIDYDEERRLDELNFDAIMQYSPFSIFWRLDGDECSLPVDFDESVSKSFPYKKKDERIRIEDFLSQIIVTNHLDNGLNLSYFERIAND